MQTSTPANGHEGLAEAALETRAGAVLETGAEAAVETGVDAALETGVEAASTPDLGDDSDENVLDDKPSAGAERIVNRVLRRASKDPERRREAEQDRVLVNKAKQGDKAAFRKLVERHQRRAFSIALGLVRDENDAREVVQDAFVRVYRNLDRFEGTSAFFTWLYRIVTNLAIDHMRRPARREQELLDTSQTDDDADLSLLATPQTDALDVLQRQQLATSIQEALDALPSYHRAVILMREVEGMSYLEMAEAMGVSKGTIMSRLFHARRKLQLTLADCYAEQFGVRAPANAATPQTATDPGDDS
ncbi:MAG: sigma-70 family RNA polymerase sigma factor [Myxococcales bacterium]|nr:sigma-70 family RNA polymerase sigma factor [Myxococcales bacterium]